MFSKAMIPVLASALVVVAPAMADPDYGWQDDRPPDQQGPGYNPGYNDGSNSDPGYDYARVTQVTPHYQQVRISVPRQECYTETRYAQEQRYDGYDRDRAVAGGTVIGGIIGAVIGHQIGHGPARGLGTVAGAVIGGAIGHDAAQRNAGPDDGDYDYRGARPIERERCVTRYNERVEQRVDGYHVCYRYQGRDYQTDLPYDPGERLRVRVTVSPQGY
jgi:uncharacterized protein YcfJ